MSLNLIPKCIPNHRFGASSHHFFYEAAGFSSEAPAVAVVEPSLASPPSVAVPPADSLGCSLEVVAAVLAAAGCSEDCSLSEEVQSVYKV